MNTLAVMLSGGLDSFIAYRLAMKFPRATVPRFNMDGYSLEEREFRVVTPMFVDYGQPYREKELAAVEKLVGDSINLVKVKADLAVPQLNNVPTVKKQVINGRNTLMAFYGGMIADTVYIASLETEMTPISVADKHPTWFKHMSDVLSYSNQSDVLITTPFLDYTKSDIIYHALHTSVVTEDELRSTVSCYDENHQNCGKCSTCFKRWVAMTNNRIEEDYTYHPYNDNEYARTIVEEMRNEYWNNQYSGRYTMKRIIETHRALWLAGIRGIF